MKCSCSGLAGVRRADTWLTWVVLHLAALGPWPGTPTGRRGGRAAGGQARRCEGGRQTSHATGTDGSRSMW